MSDLFVAPGVVIPSVDLSWTAVRSGGPGGQNVNKVASKVELRFDLPGSGALSPEVKARLRRLAAGRLDADGKILIVSQVTRAQPQNLEDARERLAQLVRAALRPPKRRKPTRPTRASKERRLGEKRKQSDKKRTRRTRGGDD
jgi:ribosome-associated protein